MSMDAIFEALIIVLALTVSCELVIHRLVYSEYLETSSPEHSQRLLLLLFAIPCTVDSSDQSSSMAAVIEAEAVLEMKWILFDREHQRENYCGCGCGDCGDWSERRSGRPEESTSIGVNSAAIEDIDGRNGSFGFDKAMILYSDEATPTIDTPLVSSEQENRDECQYFKDTCEQSMLNNSECGVLAPRRGAERPPLLMF
jgi:hypothetical protein